MTRMCSDYRLPGYTVFGSKGTVLIFVSVYCVFWLYVFVNLPRNVDYILYGLFGLMSPGIGLPIPIHAVVFKVSDF